MKRVREDCQWNPSRLLFSSQFPAGTNKYLYKGEEKLDDKLLDTYLDWDDKGARLYDPMNGRRYYACPVRKVVYELRWALYH